jgi:hypothetical protein
MPVTAWSKAWDCGNFFAGIAGSNLAGAGLSVVSAVGCQTEVSASVWSLVQRSLTEFGASECDREASIMRRPWPKGELLRHKKYITIRFFHIVYRLSPHKNFVYSVLHNTLQKRISKQDLYHACRSSTFVKLKVGFETRTYWLRF